MCGARLLAEERSGEGHGLTGLGSEQRTERASCELGDGRRGNEAVYIGQKGKEDWKEVDQRGGSELDGRTQVNNYGCSGYWIERL